MEGQLRHQQKKLLSPFSLVNVEKEGDYKLTLCKVVTFDEPPFNVKKAKGKGMKTSQKAPLKTFTRGNIMEEELEDDDWKTATIMA